MQAFMVMGFSFFTTSLSATLPWQVAQSTTAVWALCENQT
jgi:hypothetical protein